MNGVLVVDKPGGLSSHDVVARVRRVAGQRSVGHAGTLDPMATGVLVVLLGEGTKLASYLTADDKVYRAAIRLGSETDTLDAEGEVVERAPVPALDVGGVRRVVESFLGPQQQRAPVVSALKVNGRALHERYRRGEEVEAPIRAVRMRWFDGLTYADGLVTLRVGVAKGYYVRSLARDLGLALGTRGHLEALRREASGALELRDAVPLDALLATAGPERLASSLLSLADAVAHLPQVELSAAGANDAFHGRLVRAADYTSQAVRVGDQPLALLGPDGSLVAIGQGHAKGTLRVVRGFRCA